MLRRFNKKQMQATRRYLRNNSTSAENLIWIYLKNRQVYATRFLRQFSIDNYVVDFYSPLVKLVIEIDGDTHFESVEAIEYDRIRQQHIEEMGIVFLRFRNEEVYNSLDAVMEKIKAKVKELRKIKSSKK